MMDISEKQAVWREQKPLFEAEFIHSHLLPFFNFNENTGDYEIKSECVNNTDDEDRKVAYETLNTGWVMWLRAKRDAKAQAVPEGFVLIKDDTKTVVAIEQMVEQQVEASGMDSRRLERLDGWKIIEAAVKAQEPTND
jgi:hypothetical protein